MRGFSLIELLVVIAIIAIIMAMAIPKIHEAKILAAETGAAKAITTIHTAQAQYQSQYGRFAATPVELGPPAAGAASASAADLISSGLARGEKGGYRYNLQATEGGYTINATPVAFGSSGRHTYYSDQTLVIRQNLGPEPATASSPELDPR